MTASIAVVKDTWRTVVRLWKEHPIILMPFVFVGASYAAVLALIFLAPRFPFSLLLAPIIRAFWGEHFLHYPFNLLLLPQLFGYGKTAVDLILGVLLTGTAIRMLQQAYQNTRPGWVGGLKAGGQRYGRVALVWTVMILVALVTVRFVARWSSLSSGSAISLAFFAGAVAQMLFVFAIPAIVIENLKVLPAIRRSFALCKKLPLESMLFILLPHLLFLLFIYSFLHLSKLVDFLPPEAALYMLALRILSAVVLDILIVSNATVLLLKYREREYGSAAL